MLILQVQVSACWCSMPQVVASPSAVINSQHNWMFSGSVKQPACLTQPIGQQRGRSCLLQKVSLHKQASDGKVSTSIRQCCRVCASSWCHGTGHACHHATSLHQANVARMSWHASMLYALVAVPLVTILVPGQHLTLVAAQSCVCPPCMAQSRLCSCCYLTCTCFMFACTCAGSWYDCTA